MRKRLKAFPVTYFSLVSVLCSLTIACSKSEKGPGENGGTSAGAVAAKTGDAADNTSIIVNGQALTRETIQQLQQIYPVQLPPGRYWYDAVSGAWGPEGQPIAGQMMPNLALGQLAADASRGTSGVFINGRQITHGEKSYIENACQTPVQPGRYWIMASGAGGYEGGPAIFNLAACPGMQRQSGGSRSSSDTYCDANGACTTSGILGTITTAIY